jgi:hypothetical protein
MKYSQKNILDGILAQIRSLHHEMIHKRMSQKIDNCGKSGVY